MPLSSTTGNYTPVAGAETATAGQTIASATWNNINTDYQSALSQVGGVIYTNNGSFRIAVRTVSLSTGAVDLVVSIPMNGGSPAYQIQGLQLANATANPSAGSISLWTAAGGTGTNIVASTTLTITTSVAGTNNNMQNFTIANQNTQSFSNTTLFFRTVVAATASVDLFITVRPL